LKNNIKYIAIAIIVVLSGFVLSTNSTSLKLENASSSLEKKQPKAKEIELSVAHFSEKRTEKVSHKLDSLLKRINKRHDFHGSILIAKNDTVVYHNQVGYADFRKKTPVTESSVFQLASVSKQFTAAAIMLLYEKGSLQLNDTVNKFYPDFPYKNVTIQNLLNHTAGLPKYFWVAEHKWHKKEAPTNSEVLNLFEESYVERFFKPGRNFDYSNTAYLVLASIVEKVSGKDFGVFLKEHIFDPLQMKNTYVYNFKNDTIRSNQLIGYRLYRGWRHLKIGMTVNDAVVGDKNVYATAEDLFKWTLGLNNGKLLKKETVDLMFTKGETVYGRKVPYGFGFRIDTKDRNAIYHYGKWNGFSTGLSMYPQDDLTIIVLEHTSYNSMKHLNKKMKEIVLENFSS
jgi:CubicO group peptidase (beta-lactamase class C family)